MAAEPTNSAETDARTFSCATTMKEHGMIHHLETIPTSEETLDAEGNGIYAGLHMVESKCIETDRIYQDPLKILTSEQLLALVKLHWVLIDEQYDLFLVSERPCASPRLQDFPTKYTLPGRLWRHGIHALLEVMRHRLPNSREVMYTFLDNLHAMLGLYEETVPRFRITWIECKGDLARFRSAIEDDLQRRQWTKTSAELYSQVIDHEPLVGRLYHHLAISSRDDGALPQIFCFIKALVVKTAYFPARSSIFNVTDPIVKKKHADPFLTAVSHLVLAFQAPELRREKGHDTSKYDHRQSCCRALKELLLNGDTVTSPDELQLLASIDCYIGQQWVWVKRKLASPSQTASHANKNKEAKPTGKVQAYTLRPSHELGVLLCMLLLGIPQSDKTQSTTMAAWAPDYVKAADRADLAAKVASGTDIYEDVEPAAYLAKVTITHILTKADTTDVQFWEFVHVILVFMRAMMTRPDMHKRFGWAFPAHRFAPFLNMALRDAESRGRDWNTLSQQGFPTMVYGHTEKMRETAFTTPLPEDKALRGLFFARQSGCRTGPPVNSRDAKPSVPEEATEATTGDQERAEPSEEPKEKEDKAAQLAEEKKVEEARRAEEERLAEEARLQHVEDVKAESRDPNFFPCRWFDESKYDYEEERIRKGSVQDEETCFYRIDRILWTASQLMQRPDGTPGFFSLETDEDRRPHIVAPGIPSPQTSPDAKMPEVFERDGGGRVVFVDPCLIGHAARKDKGEEKEKRKETEEAGAGGDAAAAVDIPMSAFKLQLIEVNSAKTEHDVLLQHQTKSGHDYSATNKADNGSLGESNSGDGESEEDRKFENAQREIVLSENSPQDTEATDTLAVTIMGTDQSVVTEQQLNEVFPLKKHAANHGAALTMTVAEGEEDERDWEYVSKPGSDDCFDRE